MKTTIFILNTCDAWHSHESMERFGIYSTLKKTIEATAEFNLNQDEIRMLETQYQTQGRESNLTIEEVGMDSIYTRCRPINLKI